MFIDVVFLGKVIVRLLLAVLMGSLIGTERAKMDSQQVCVHIC